jgi:hypothetical protein
MSPTTRLQTLIHNPHDPIGAIAAMLDALGTDERWRELSRLTRDDQRKLYEKAGASPALSLEDFVAASLGPRRPVIHKGRNTLPGLEKLRFFEKRFVWPEGENDRLFGYNEGFARKFIGPGYFVALPTQGRHDWTARGSIVIDYFQVPNTAVAEGWPKVIDNSVGPQRLVYYHTRDFMRRVSSGVTIGAAYKEERPLDHYFVLCRQDG